MSDAQALDYELRVLREKQLHGGGLSDDEVREGLRLIVEIRRLRAGTGVGKMTKEAATPLEKLF